MHFKILIIKIIFLFLSLSLYAGNFKNIKIVPKYDSINFEAEVSDSKKKRAKGLMYRKSLKKNKGMLFVYNKEEDVHIWMKNTYINLDIIFISKNKIIIDFKKNAKKLSTTIISSKAKYVLEINSGLINKYKINIGDKLYFE